jgi:hypothetical protein
MALTLSSRWPFISSPRPGLSWIEEDRHVKYARYLRTYQGYAVRGDLGGNAVTGTKRIRFNFCRPVVNLASAFLAAKPLNWEIKDNPEAEAEAYRIWDRSVEENSFYEAAKTASILGDLVVVVAQDADGEPILEFVDPSICYPRFSGKNANRLEELEIRFEEERRDERRIRYTERYLPDRAEFYEDDTLVDTIPYRSLPAAWIRNQPVIGQSFGMSDLDGVVELTQLYDHLTSKQAQIVDLNAAPIPVISGMKYTAEVEKNLKSVWFLEDSAAKAFYLEHNARPEALESILARIVSDLHKLTQIPPIAFGQMDTGVSQISGVAMSIIYGPLLAKTNEKRGPMAAGLERGMAIALQAKGFTVHKSQIKAMWQDPLPKDVLAAIQAESLMVSGGLSSVRAAMDRLGVDSPEDELKRIGVEKILLRAATQPALPPMPPPVAEDAQDGDTGEGGREGRSMPSAPMPVATDPAGQVREFVEAFDAVIAEEQEQAAADEAERGRD